MKQEKAILLCRQLAQLLAAAGEQQYAAIFNDYAIGLAEGDWDVEKRRVLQTFKGGMGSFNDLVLHKDGTQLGAQNNELHRLKEALYNTITVNW